VCVRVVNVYIILCNSKKNYTIDKVIKSRKKSDNSKTDKRITKWPPLGRSIRPSRRRCRLAVLLPGTTWFFFS
jgi:hypothetical protein